jgi:DNA-binding LacI/PurR family transcriptional regulator
MLAQGRTRIIGVFPLEGKFPYTLADFYYPYLVGIEREATIQDYNVLLFTRNQTKLPKDKVQENINSLRLADGLVLAGNYPDPALLRSLKKENFPFVLIGRSGLPKDEVDSVVNNHEPTSYEAARHLIELNHRRLGLIVDDLDLAYHQERFVGCRRAVDEVPDAELTILDGRTVANANTFAEAIREYGITAVLCADRKLVTPTLDFVQQNPIKVPDGISLVLLVTNTWDIPFGNPTRVNLNRDIKGRVAVQRLIKRLEGKLNGYEQLVVPCQFVIGDTTAPL